MKHHSLTIVLFLGTLGLQAQQVEFFVTEYNQASYQLDESTLVGMGTRNDWNWPSFSFYAAIDTVELTPTITNARLTGTSFPGDLSIPWNDPGYDVFVEYASLQEMAGTFQGGSHAFAGTGTGLGNFSESVTLPAYNKLSDRLVTNFNQLQAFDPNAPVEISWEAFTEGLGTFQAPDGTTLPRGFIEIYISYWDETEGFLTIWSHFDTDDVNELGGLPASQNSVTIPAGTLTASTTGYSVDIYFVRVEVYEAADAVNGAIVVHLRSMDTILDIWPQGSQGSPWPQFPQLTEYWIDTGSWLGFLNWEHAPWIYSENEKDYIYIPDNAVFNEGAWMWVPAPMAP